MNDDLTVWQKHDQILTIEVIDSQVFDRTYCFKIFLVDIGGKSVLIINDWSLVLHTVVFAPFAGFFCFIQIKIIINCRKGAQFLPFFDLIWSDVAIFQVSRLLPDLEGHFFPISWYISHFLQYS